MPLMLIVFLFVYLLLSFYVAFNGWVWLKKSYGFLYKKTYFFMMFLISISFFISQFIHIQLLSWIGYIWLIVFGYSLLLFPLFNIVYYLTKKRAIKWYGYVILPLYSFVLLYGSFNMWNPVVVSYDVEVDKETELEELKIMMVSDIHINEMVGYNSIKRLVDLSKEVDPDIIFLAGDVIDNSIEPYLTYNLGEILSGLTAPMGVYAVLGNHEYYGGDIPVFLEEMNEIGIQVLVDEVINFDELFYIVGRKDLTDKERKSIDFLTKQLNKEKPIFLLDHQPKEYDEVSEATIDVMVSGHTHKGQIFPANLITKIIYENHYGYLRKNNLQTIVSSGYGIWGPPFRIGSRAEVVEINVKFVK